MVRRSLLFYMCIVALGTLQAAEVSDLPNVLIIGDSISMGYTPPVKKLLKDKAVVVHNPGNAQHSGYGLENLDAWLGDTAWDVIHFNHGLHDLKHVDDQGRNVSARGAGHIQIPVDQYEMNMEAIVLRLKQTGAKLIFATTTPFAKRVSGPLRDTLDASRYNIAALRVMRKHGVRVNDLYDLVQSCPKAILQPRNVHFTKEGSQMLAEQVAKHVLDALDRKPPNILLIMADDLGYECIGANGGTSYQTPVLDSLAATGMRFEHCYAQPLCTPSRVKIMTGIYNVRNYVKFGVLDRSQTTFAHLFKRAGYATCVAGKWQLGKQVDAPTHFGFDEACLWQHTRGNTNQTGQDSRYENPRLEINGKTVDFAPGQYGPDVVSDYLCSFMERHKDTPFLAYYPMILTHCPFVPTPNSEDWDPQSLGSETYKGKAEYFGDMVQYMDKIVGKLVEKLEALGLRDNTLILFVGDNGTDVPVVSMMDGRAVAGAKGKTTDGGTRVPCIVSWPDVISSGRTCTDLLDFSDVLPTLCEAASIPLPETPAMDGRSFLPQLKGHAGNPRDWIYCWYSRSGARDKAKVFARNQRYKLYRSGKFYDIQNDVLEKQPLTQVSLSKNVQQVHGMLSKALEQFKDARPAGLP